MEILHVRSTESRNVAQPRRIPSAIVRQLLVIGGAWLVVAAGSAPALAAQGFLNCASNGYRYNYCSANTQGRVVMLREVSSGNLCRQGRGWGYDNGGIWVDKGCRAEFSYGRDNNNWSGGGNWNGPGTLTCESISYRYRRCDADTQNRVNLMRELSTGNLCRQGYGWGYDSRAIWVDRGCRGEFSYGRDSNSGNRHNDAAIAAGIIGALAIGAAIGSSQASAPPPAPPPPPPPPAVAAQGPPAWVIGSYHAYDSDSGDIAQLVVDGGGRVYLRDESGNVVNQGQLRDGLVTWNNGKKSFIAREGPGVMIGDVETGKHYYFRRNT